MLSHQLAKAFFIRPRLNPLKDPSDLCPGQLKPHELVLHPLLNQVYAGIAGVPVKGITQEQRRAPNKIGTALSYYRESNLS